MSGKYSFCQSCYYNNREPTICETCEHGSEYEPADELEGRRNATKQMKFRRRDIEKDAA